MDKISLLAKARELKEKALATSSGRAADTVHGGHAKRLRQTVIALRAGTELAEHENPGEATMLVISGQLWLLSGENKWSGREWDHLLIPDASHSVRAETDAVFLLTVAKDH